MAINGKVEVAVKLTGKGNAEAKIKGVRGELDKTAGSAKLTASSMLKAGAAVAGVVSGLMALHRAAAEGRKAVRIAAEFKREFRDAEIGMGQLRAAVGHAIDDTSIQAAAASMRKLGLSAEQTRDLLDMTARATLATTGTIEGALDAATQAAQGRTRSLAKLGIIVNDQQAIRSYAQEHGILVAEMTKEQRAAATVAAALDKLHERYGNTAPVDRQISKVEKSRTAWDNLKSDLEVGAAAIEDAFAVGADAASDFTLEVATGHDGTRHLRREINRMAAASGNAAASEVELKYQIAEMAQATEGLTAEQIDWYQSMLPLHGVLGSITADALDAVKAQRELEAATKDAAAAARQQAHALAAVGDMYHRVGMAGLSNALTGAKRAEAPDTKARAVRHGGAGGSRLPRWQRDAARALQPFADEADIAAKLAQLDALDAQLAELRAEEMRTGSAMSGMMDALVGGVGSATDAIAQAADAWEAQQERIAAAAQRVRDDIVAASDAIGGAASDMSAQAPELSGALDSVAGGLRAYADADTIAGKSTAAAEAFGGVVSSFIQDAKAQAVIAALVETAKGIGSAADGDWAAAGGHFAAAAAWGVVAGTSAPATSGGSVAGSTPAAGGGSTSLAQQSQPSDRSTAPINIYVQGAVIARAQELGALVNAASAEAGGMRGGRV